MAPSTPPSSAPAPAIVGRPPAAVWALVVVQLGLALTWSILAPTYRAPDEPSHVDLALQLAWGQPYPEPGDGLTSAPVAASAVQARLSVDGSPRPNPRDLPLTVEDATPRGQRQPFRALADAERTPFFNQMPQHPPAYYLGASVPLRMLEGTRWDAQVWTLRALGALLLAPLPLLAWAVARRCTPDHALAAAAVPCAIPMLAHIGGAASNDTPLVLLVGAATVGVAAVLAGDLRLRTAGFLGLVAGLALLTKGFALFLPLWIALAYGVVAWRGRGRAARGVAAAVVPAALSLGLMGVVGGWWWLRNIVVHGTVQPDAFVRPPPPVDFAPDAGWWVQHAASRLVLRFWGQFGWVEVPLPWLLVWVLAALLAVAVAAGLVANRRCRPDLLVVLVPVTAIAVIVVAGAWEHYARTAEPAGLHGRYLYAGLAGLAAAAGAAAAALPRRLGRWVPVGVLGLAAGVQCYAGWLVFTHWWVPEDGGLGAGMSALAAWSPLALRWVVAIVAGTGVAWAAAVALCIPRQHSRAAGTAGGEPRRLAPPREPSDENQE